MQAATAPSAVRSGHAATQLAVAAATPLPRVLASAPKMRRAVALLGAPPAPTVLVLRSALSTLAAVLRVSA